jgi:hypothetical protein
MEKLSPGARKALREAYLYGYLFARNGKLYLPGGYRSPICPVEFASPLIKLGLLVARGDKYEITPDGRQAEMEF